MEQDSKDGLVTEKGTSIKLANGKIETKTKTRNKAIY